MISCNIELHGILTGFIITQCFYIMTAVVIKITCQCIYSFIQRISLNTAHGLGAVVATALQPWTKDTNAPALLDLTC